MSKITVQYTYGNSGVGVKGLKWIIIYRRQNDVLET